MAKTRSSKSTYPSRFGGGHITIAQYITEYLCENIARVRGKELPQQFWEIEEWAKFFRTQITLLNRHLIKSYHPRAIVKALKDPRCKYVNSFGGFMKVPNWKKVLTEMDSLCKIEDQRDSNLKLHIAPDATKSKPIKRTGNKTILSKLRETDDGKEESRSRD
jgi:hypothetical protein